MSSAGGPLVHRQGYLRQHLDATGQRTESPAAWSPEGALEAASLYDALEHAVAPLHYGRPPDLAAIRRNAIALNGSFFSTHRMVREYLAKAYAPAR